MVSTAGFDVSAAHIRQGNREGIGYDQSAPLGIACQTFINLVNNQNHVEDVLPAITASTFEAIDQSSISNNRVIIEMGSLN